MRKELEERAKLFSRHVLCSGAAKDNLEETICFAYYNGAKEERERILKEVIEKCTKPRANSMTQFEPFLELWHLEDIIKGEDE